MEKILEIKKLTKSYGNRVLFENVDLDLNYGDVVGIVGPSGAGKTTFLKCVNGLILPDCGSIYFEGTDINEINKVQLRQDIGIVFQDYNLFEHMNVIDNLTVALKCVKKMNDDVAKRKAKKLLKKFNLINKEFSYPDQLSGGERQRIAIIRTLLMGPKVILLDEPTSALDKNNKNQVFKIIEELSNNRITLIIVSHEEQFIKKVSNKIIKIGYGEKGCI